jgi:methionyl-tRNA synthetase
MGRQARLARFRGFAGQELAHLALKDRCITRDLAWGVPVPRPMFEGKVFYAWFDAPIAYIATAQNWAEADTTQRDWRQWRWQSDDVQYIQFLGKDNIPFHAVSFPATLIGSGEPWNTVDIIKGFHWLSYQGGKFSTTGKRGIFTDQALDELPADLWRWWLSPLPRRRQTPTFASRDSQLT